MKVRGSESRSSGSVSLPVKAGSGARPCSSSANSGESEGKPSFAVFMLLLQHTECPPPPPPSFSWRFSIVILGKERNQEYIDLIDLNPRYQVVSGRRLFGTVKYLWVNSVARSDP